MHSLSHTIRATYLRPLSFYSASSTASFATAIAGATDKRNKAIIHEVTARDGLQNEKKVLDVPTKVKLIEKILETGIRSVEVASFVRDDLVPAMAGAKDLCLRLNDSPVANKAKQDNIHFAALVPNMRGYDTFRKSKGVLDTVVCLVSCSESHSKANVNRSMKDALLNTCDIIQAAKADKVRVQAYASLAFGCPFEGKVSEDVVLSIVSKYNEVDADVIILADTLGVAVPEQVQSLVTKIIEMGIKPEKLGLHMHDSHGRAHENIDIASKLGIRRFDSAAGGCGGCNFVPNAQGNVSTQDVLAVLQRNNIEHGVSIDKTRELTEWLEQAIGRGLKKSSIKL